ncbi:EscU/YscU/HrcU family type III secretion system export apparatus switch protein [Proteiniborus sp.]|uniref:EscU/YscU/HrcU family type III secretion system export apparatus switch protein n=1 Tax=Proteiniborus sp. TaxID=2079015 RepID=UPI003320C838
MNKKNGNKIAVAIQYNIDKKEAPFVIAKGKGIVAEKIIEKGFEEGVHIVEDQLLADSLVNLEILEEIPEELYTAVAEILSFIYNLDKERDNYYE